MENRQIFIDTGAWFAVADASDQYHQQAIQVYPGLFKENWHLATTNLVIAETYILIRRAIGHTPAMTFLKNIAESPRVEKIYSDPILEQDAEHILGSYQDQDLSYVDAVSFAAMTRNGIDRAFSFDRHFITAGYDVIPKLSLEEIIP